MFTGIIKDMGRVCSLKKGPTESNQLKQVSDDLHGSDDLNPKNLHTTSLDISIETQLPWDCLEEGSSIACNGVCLTVVERHRTSDDRIVFSANVGPKTLELGCFQNIQVGEAINLEPALQACDYLGGHMVQGHVDTTLKVSNVQMLETGFILFCLEIPFEFQYYVVEKGSIAIAGVSLTIAKVHQGGGTLEIMLIPHTLEKTNLKHLKIGHYVEVEFDTMVKTTHHLLTKILCARGV